MSQPRTPSNPDTLERANYFPRQIVSPSDLAQDDTYLLHKLRRHNRLLHGWGFRLGFVAERILGKDADEWIKSGVLPKGILSQKFVDYWLHVTLGYAITPLGDELYLPKQVFLNTAEELDGALVVLPGECPSSLNPKDMPRKDNLPYSLIVEAYESEVQPVRAASNRCGDHPDQFEYSRIKDTLRFRLIDYSAPPPFGPPDEDRKLLTGKPDRGRTFLVLGKVRFKDNKISGDVSQGSDRDPQLAPAATSAPVPGAMRSRTDGTSIHELPELRSLTTNEQYVLNSLTEKDIAIIPSREAFIAAVTETCRRKNLPAPDARTLGVIWEAARQSQRS
jgi:hypothetical protein